MLSGVELHLPLHTVAPASSTTQIDVCSRDTSSPTYCCCGFMLVLRFKVAEARRYQPPLLRLPDVPTCVPAEHRAQRHSRMPHANAAAPAQPARSVLDRASTVLG